MMSDLVKFMVMWPNAFPLKGCILGMSPRWIVLGYGINYKTHFKVMFGYVQKHDNNGPSNTLEAQTTGSIALGPYFHGTVGYNFMKLQSGQKLHRMQWTQIPIT